jgi:hypothetical protein
MTDGALTILDPVADTTPNTGFDRKQPVDPRDKFVLPDGSVGSSIIDAGGFMDAGTSRGFIGELLLGSVVREASKWSVRMFRTCASSTGCVYIERAPGYWVQVCDAGLYKTFSPHECHVT